MPSQKSPEMCSEPVGETRNPWFPAFGRRERPDPAQSVERRQPRLPRCLLRPQSEIPENARVDCGVARARGARHRQEVRARASFSLEYGCSNRNHAFHPPLAFPDFKLVLAGKGLLQPFTHELQADSRTGFVWRRSKSIDPLPGVGNAQSHRISREFGGYLHGKRHLTCLHAEFYGVFEKRVQKKTGNPKIPRA